MEFIIADKGLSLITLSDTHSQNIYLVRLTTS